ncbi:MAG TPA: TadE family protein, partial [Candidatus Limnocylindria bacterium]|nr:TadE family protein [Candidatus Limnocylindria bacterium]
MSKPRDDARSRRGQTLVEFALILPIFLLVLVGIFDMGRAVYAYNTISNASRQAVRLGIVDQNVT